MLSWLYCKMCQLRVINRNSEATSKPDTQTQRTAFASQARPRDSLNAIGSLPFPKTHSNEILIHFYKCRWYWMPKRMENRKTQKIPHTGSPVCGVPREPSGRQYEFHHTLCFLHTKMSPHKVEGKQGQQPADLNKNTMANIPTSRQIRNRAYSMESSHMHIWGFLGWMGAGDHHN